MNVPQLWSVTNSTSFSGDAPMSNGSGPRRKRTRARTRSRCSGSLADVRPVHVQRVLDEAIAAGLSARSVVQVHRILHAAFRQAVRWQLVAANPSDGVTPPKLEARGSRSLTPPMLRGCWEPWRRTTEQRWRSLHRRGLDAPRYSLLGGRLSNSIPIVQPCASRGRCSEPTGVLRSTRPRRPARVA
jgi:hypothetical protein